VDTKDTSLWNRKCPSCGCFQSFATKRGLSRAIKLDLQRQKEIAENIKPRSFIRYDERNNRLYDVITNYTILEIKK
jgi:hypothetical protein